MNWPETCSLLHVFTDGILSLVQKMQLCATPKSTMSFEGLIYHCPTNLPNFKWNQDRFWRGLRSPVQFYCGSPKLQMSIRANEHRLFMFCMTGINLNACFPLIVLRL